MTPALADVIAGAGFTLAVVVLAAALDTALRLRHEARIRRRTARLDQRKGPKA